MYITIQRKQQDRTLAQDFNSLAELKTILEQSPAEILAIAICEADKDLPYSELQAIFNLFNSKATNLRTLDFTDSQLDPRLFKSLTELLTTSRLTELMLAGSIKDETNFSEICYAATKCKSLRVLDLQGFSTLSNQGALTLCNMIKENNSINELLISNLQLEENQVPLLLESLNQNSTITAFYLRDSELIDQEYQELDQIQKRNKYLHLLFKEKQYPKIAEILFNSFKENNLVAGLCILNLIKINHSPAQQTNSEQVFGQDNETLLKLIDLYLNESISGRLVIKDKNRVVDEYTNRDALLAPENKRSKEYWQRHAMKVDLILTAIRAYCPALSDYSRSKLDSFYDECVKKNQRYFSADCSDDSDSDDELVLKGKKLGDAEKSKHFSEVRACQNDAFWKKTKRVTPRNAGLTDKLPGIGNVTVKALAPALQTITGHIDRAKIPGTSSVPNAARLFVAKVRGLNYMKDRWSTAAKRYHYKMNEVNQPQFSEAILKTLPFDFYTELNSTNDYSRNAYSNKLLSEAERLRQNYRQLKTRGPFLAKTVKPSESYYVFNTVNDYLQHGFSNGINQHLLELRDNRHLDIFAVFPNAYNYAIATGDRPYHSLKYATGLKEYYQDNFEVRYNQDGSIINSHAGKTFIILQEANQFISQDACNRLLPLNHTGRVPLDPLITPELETSYIGYIPGEFVVYQSNIKFPSFNKPYKEIYEIKYGMDLNLYTQFQRLIKSTPVGSEERNAVIKLLKEWLCAYHEVLLLEIAQREAKRRSGCLIYVDYQNKVADIPDMGPLIKGHIDSQNRVHVLQDIRWRLGEIYSSSLAKEQPNFAFISSTDLKTRMEALAKDHDEIVALGKKVKISETSMLYNAIWNKKILEENAKAQIASEILTSMSSFNI